MSCTKHKEFGVRNVFAVAIWLVPIEREIVLSPNDQ